MANTTDFEPATDTVAYEDLRPVDKYMLIRLNQTIQTVRDKGYDKYDFVTIYKTHLELLTVNCHPSTWTSPKMWVYIEAEDAPARRSMQTVFYQTAVALTKLLAPILLHTAEEIWSYLKEEEEYVQLAEFPAYQTPANQRRIVGYLELPLWTSGMKS